MTRHNLDEHLSWLLSTKATLPPATSSLPPAPFSYTPIEASEPISNETQLKQTPTRQRLAENSAAVGPQGGTEMVKLPTVPGSAGRRNLVSMGPTVPEVTPSYRMSPSVPPRGSGNLQSASRQQLVRESPLQPDRQASTATSDVEIMDLTETLSQMGSPTPTRIAGWKRKSSELESDFPTRPCPQHGDMHGVQFNHPPRTSQQSFTAIDEIIEEPQDPPPPYSTVPPMLVLHAGRPSVGSSSTLSNGHARVMADSEDDDDDKFVDFTGSQSKLGHRRHGTQPSKKRALTRQKPIASPDSIPRSFETDVGSMQLSIERQSIDPATRSAWQTEKQNRTLSTAQAEDPAPTPTAATQENKDSETVKWFFDLPRAEIHKVVQLMETRKDDICDAITHRLDQDQDTKNLDEQLDELDRRYEALKIISSKRDDYRGLCDEREQLLAALKHAIKARQNRAQANEAHKACKDKIQQLETQCLGFLQLCQSEIEALFGPPKQSRAASNRRTIAVQSTQAPVFPPDLRQAADPSSSRVAQTQVAKPDSVQHSKLEVPVPLVRQSEIRAANIEAYFSPSKKKAARSINNQDRAQPVCDKFELDKSHDDYLDELNDEDVFGGTNTLFSNRMGTPPAPFDPNDEDDFGIGDDDDMLEFAEDIENDIQPTRPSQYNSTRPVFAETSGNGQSKPFNTSAKKTRRTPAKTADAGLEELFRFRWSDDVVGTLKGRFGMTGFRENQVQAINATLAGKDTFVLMPTGGGKSLCYQLPSLIRCGETRGVTIVISPLLSLMEDQVQHLRKLHIQAFLINGESTPEDKRAINDALRENAVEDYLQLLYVTPEMLSKNQFMLDTFQRLYQRQKLARLVIDEAHCVSQWGHDFRPDYKLLGDVRRKFPKVPVMALTATATENVKLDVIHNLAIEGCEVFTQSFNRPNLYYEVRPKGKKKECFESIANLIKENHAKQTGIIYCLSRQACEDMAKILQKEHKIRAHHYHAKMDPMEKREVQKHWQAGKYHVIVATIAFGMGIDKGNVRFVIHHSIPKSLEGYYQETGRAGRDRGESSCYLFYGYQDASVLRRMIDDGDGSGAQKDRQYLMLQKMIQYCENKSDCRRVQVLSYFNESFHPDGCKGKCDNCNSTSTFENLDFTDAAQQVISLVRQVAPNKVTVVQCIDIFRGATTKATKKIMENAPDGIAEYGAGQDLDRGDVERLFSQLLNEQAIREDNVKNGMGFYNQYVALGRNCNQYQSGKKHLYMQIRSTPQPKAKVPAKKAAKKDVGEGQSKQRKKRPGAMDPPELPLSTNVSSPIQAASTRKKAKQPAGRNIHGNGYHHDDFVVPDPDNDSFAGTEDESSDAFEPIRVAGLARREKTRVPGPPITSDNLMESLDEVHRALVYSSVELAGQKIKDIMLNKNLRTAPFSELMLRQMFAYWTETEDQMLKIPGISPEKVQLYGRPFCRMVQDSRRTYEDMVAQDEDRPDPNAQNVIDLVSESDDGDEDDYGSLGPSDIEAEEDPGEPSAYFRPNAKVEAFNARFGLSQPEALRPVAASQPVKKQGPKGKKRFWRATGSNSTTNRKGFPGGSRQSFSAFNDAGTSSRVTKKRALGKRSNGNGGRRSNSMFADARNSSRSARGGGGISMMPT